MTTFLLVLALGALGSAARYLVDSALTARLGDAWPWGTFVVNVTGCFAAGLVTSRVVLVGLVGAYTTFSTYAVEVVKVDGSSRPAALAYGLGSVVAGVLAAGLGLVLRG
ncbi:MAG TPA: CrcB family protein [Frankiaceae bacterium]|nr:CrcB family protein [Frankiaceae bacterium]